MSGVGKTKGVGVVIKGRLHAAETTKMVVNNKKSDRFFDLILPPASKKRMLIEYSSDATIRPIGAGLWSSYGLGGHK
jgi:hypothetical protein